MYLLGSKVTPPMRLSWKKTIHGFNVNTDIKRDLEKCLETAFGQLF